MTDEREESRTAGGARVGSESARLVNGLIWVAAVILLTGGVVIYALLSLAAEAQNRSAIRAAEQTAAALIAEQGWQLGLNVRDYAWWDDTVARVLVEPDPAWIDSNIGLYFTDAFDATLTLVVGGDGRVISATSDGTTTAAFDASRLGQGVAAVIAAAQTATTADGGPEPVSGLGLVDGRPHLLAASRIVPEEPDSPPSPDPMAIFLAGRPLEPNGLDPLRFRFAMPDLRLAESDADPALLLPARQVLRDRNGHPLVTATWTPPLPGRDFIRQSMPLLGGAFLLMAALILAFLLRARHLSHRLAHDAEQQARESRELAHRRLAQGALVANAPVALFTLDAAGQLSSLEGDPGLTGDLALALGWPAAVLDPRAEGLGVAAGLDDMLAAVRAGRAAEREVVAGNRVLNLLLVPAVQAPVGGEAGGSAGGGAVGVVTDISDRRRAEQSLRFTLDRLTRSNAELERFAHVASHDLQEPVRTVVAFAQLLERRLDDRLDAESRDYLRFLVDGAKRMRNLALDLMAYTQVAGQAPPMLIELDDVLDAALANLDGAILASGARIHRPGRLPAVRGEASLLLELFQNLIANAIKFRHPARTPDITVTLLDEEKTGEKQEWTIAVADNGIGIDPAYRTRIFEIFKRLHPGDQFTGTGVGLALCRRIAEVHGGSIALDGSYAWDLQGGGGARFLLTLPKPPPALASLSEAAAEDDPPPPGT